MDAEEFQELFSKRSGFENVSVGKNKMRSFLGWKYCRNSPWNITKIKSRDKNDGRCGEWLSG